MSKVQVQRFGTYQRAFVKRMWTPGLLLELLSSYRYGRWQKNNSAEKAEKAEKKAGQRAGRQEFDPRSVLVFNIGKLRYLGHH